jgi:hypothetical protein
MNKTQIQKKTLSIQELSELISAIRCFRIDIDDFDEDKEIEEKIEAGMMTLFLDIDVKANTLTDDSDYSSEGYGAAYINNEDGCFSLKKARPYFEGIGEVELDKISMKVINAEIDNLKIFE